MKFHFKHKKYQKNAVDAVVQCFAGQPRREGIEYRVDPGQKKKQDKGQQAMAYEEEESSGYKNHELLIDEAQLFENICTVQKNQNLEVDKNLVKTSVCNINLDVEMETGTGKTFVYTKTIFELYKQYGWSKFIIVVPSIAIREGAAQSFLDTKEHFLQDPDYNEQAKVFIYDSKSPQNIKSFSTDGGINVMIINVQAFNATGKDARRIYEKLDEFESRRPIDMIKANRPILILDEPQKMEGARTVESLAKFNPLMILRYSATHRTVHNKIHRLDALDAYNQKLVKKISVKGISTKGLSGTNAYRYLQSIDIAKGKDPVARLEFEVKQNSGIKRITRKTEKGRDLYELSGELEQYRGFVVSDIKADENSIYFTNGKSLSAGEASGNIEESMLRRIQIREAINSHLQKELELYAKGIKVLTLFFIDEVSKYRVYGEEGREKGEYAKVFEEEYQEAVNNLGTLHHPEYSNYLKKIDADRTHNGYFSMDKKGHMTDPKVKARGEGAGLSDDVDAYDLILKDKKRLLSFGEPTRFIFSHSALREGWDNQNIFVICTLKHSSNDIARRQEVGRGMRICVNQQGERMDDPSNVHEINRLTVVASESYKDYVTALQKEIASALSDRPRIADKKYFTGKVLKTDTEAITVTEDMAAGIEFYLIQNGYVDRQHKIQDRYREAKKEESLAVLPNDLLPYAEQVIFLIDSVYDSSLLPTIDNEYQQKENPLNTNNLNKKEFKKLWENINQKAVYTVHFNSAELVRNATTALDKELTVRALQYQLVEGEMKEELDSDEMKEGSAFKYKDNDAVQTIEVDRAVPSFVKYDLIGKITQETKLTRKTVGEILRSINDKKFSYYKKNPEEFIQNCSRIINEQKATTVIEYLTYDATTQKHELQDIFTVEAKTYDVARLKEVNKHVYDYLITDSKKEKEFAEKLDVSKEVVVYAKLPKSFFIPTPVGEYNPDWAIAFEEGSVRHIYFIAETKGDMSTMQLRGVEKVKTQCAKKFFSKITSDKVKYDVVDSYEKLMELVK